ncbi:hypothetical protein OPW32_00025 [Vibrio europaeus]|uniref:hypothetical protein n=1 Tax=Vibrio europaeus TaxID=300876 RepID=UPI00233F293F|nr:hypothetical protein [Vibrio europaeus]MDC5719326.1 hypothetical protein [Vibrio europaeus]MDC5847592.1 hypothetical protein [Vibrio europaeus]
MLLIKIICFIVFMPIYGLYLILIGEFRVAEGYYLEGAKARLIGMIFVLYPAILYGIVSLIDLLIAKFPDVIGSNDRAFIVAIALSSVSYFGLLTIKRWADTGMYKNQD